MGLTTAVRRLVGKVALVTASTNGIGLAIAQRLGREGAKIVICSRKSQNVESALKQLRAERIDVIGRACHVANPEHRHNLIRETVERNGGIDILVSCAGVNPHLGPAFECTESQWDKIFDVNVKSTFFMCKEVLPHMEKRGGGSIVLMGSIQGYVAHNQDIIPYSISKTAVIGMVKALGKECGKRNVRINGLQPGIIDTKFGHAIITQMPYDTMAIPRPGRPEECAGIVAHMVSDEASYMTGENITVSGGLATRL